MAVLAIWTTWTGLLASLVLQLREAWRARRSLHVARRGADFVAVRADHGRGANVAEGSPRTTVRGQRGRRSLVVFELPGADVVVRRISVPEPAREFLAGIVQNQIDRLSPWQASQTMYGFCAQTSREAPATLDVDVLITSRSVVDTACSDLAGAGLSVDRMVARNEAGAAVVLWSRLTDAADRDHDRTRRGVGICIAGIVTATVVVGLWAVETREAAIAAIDDVVTRTAALKADLRPDRTSATLASLAPAQRAWALKEGSPVAVVVLEALSRALPATAYLSELQIDRTTLRIMGLAADAPMLVAELQRSPHFTDVHFFAPTTRSQDGARFAFHIEARIEPRLQVAGE